jgi:hypothetical protein
LCLISGGPNGPLQQPLNIHFSPPLSTREHFAHVKRALNHFGLFSAVYMGRILCLCCFPPFLMRFCWCLRRCSGIWVIFGLICFLFAFFRLLSSSWVILLVEIVDFELLIGNWALVWRFFVENWQKGILNSRILEVRALQNWHFKSINPLNTTSFGKFIIFYRF